MCLLVGGFATIVPSESHLTACNRPHWDSSELSAVESWAYREKTVLRQ